MKKEKIERLIKEALKESTFILRCNNANVILSNEYPPVVSLDIAYKDGIDLDEGENRVSYNLYLKYVTINSNGELTLDARLNNKIAIITSDSAIIDDIFYID